MSESNSAEPNRMIRVLLVEDHALTRLGLKAAFSHSGDIVVIGGAVNGEDAVEMAARLNPDVIVMDVGMPIMDGIHAAREIVALNPEVKIVMLTQHDF